MRAQVTLPALGIALLLLTATSVFVLFTAENALGSDDRDALERASAAGLSERLVDADAAHTRRANVLASGEVRNLTVADLRARYGLADDDGVRLELDDETLAADGDPATGTTVRRIVLVESRTDRSLTPRLNRTGNVTLPRRTDSATVDLQPPADTTIHTVRANGRVLLHDRSGLSGTYEIDLSRLATATLRFEAAGDLPAGSVEIDYEPITTRKAELSVTVARGRAGR